MLLSGMFQWGVRQSAEVENQMTSVERVLEYSAFEPEAPLNTEGNAGHKYYGSSSYDFIHIDKMNKL